MSSNTTTSLSAAQPDNRSASWSAPEKDRVEQLELEHKFSPDAFRSVMRNMASSVVIIATDQDDRIQAMTATAFTPVSVDPALVLFCIHLNSDTHNALRVGSKVGISFLSEIQADISQRFAKKKSFDKTIADAFTRSPDGAPIIAGGCSALSAKIITQLWGGDHSIFVAEATWGEPQEALPPLVYHNGSYVRLQQTGAS